MFGSIGRIMQAAAGKAGGGSLGTAISQAISGGAMSNVFSPSMQSMMRGAMNNVEAILGDTEKAMYIAALHAAIDKATTQQHFNIETATNDLWIKLSNIKSHKPQLGMLAEKMQSDQNLFGELKNVLEAQQRVMKSVINNLP